MHKTSWACAAIALSWFTVRTDQVQAAPLPFLTTESSNYQLIAMGSSGVVGQSLHQNSFELGANKAPVPSTSSFLNGGASGGPSLLGNVPNIPLVAKPVASGVIGGG